MANRLKEIRTALGLTQDQVGELLDTSYQQVSRLENDARRLTVAVVCRLAETLNLLPRYFIEDGMLLPPVIETKDGRKFSDQGHEKEFFVLWGKMDFDTRAMMFAIAIRVVEKADAA